MSVSKEQLLKTRVPHDDVMVEGVGVIRIRGLSRAEVLGMNKRREASPDFNFEAELISLAMVDPAMSPEDVSGWQAAATADELEQVTQRVSALSGLSKGAQKDAYKSAGDGA